MALSDIIINDAVLCYINASISESNYHILRQYLLERKPLESVINKINLLLTEHYDADKEEAINYLSKLACEAQQNSDLREAFCDEQEQNGDNDLKSHYTSELRILENQLTRFDMKSFFLQNSCSQISTQLQELKINLEQVNKEIERIHNERQLLNDRYRLHTPPVKATAPAQFTVQDQLAWNKLFQEENKLVAERQRLIYTIGSKERDNTREEHNLNKLLKEKNQTEKQYSDIQHQLDIEIPKKERERLIRTNERLARTNARETSDPNLQQLSYKNLEILKEQIASKNHELETKKNQLMDTSLETCYTVYIAQLELALSQEDGPKISFNDHEALTSILGMMKNYNDMEENARILFLSLNKEQSSLKVLQKKLTDSNALLQEYISVEPDLVQTNKNLAEENIQLKLNAEWAKSIRTNALYTSLFGLGGAIVSSGLINTFVISPMLMAIPGGLALITLVSLTVALVYHINKWSNEDQIDQNKKTILENDAVLMKHWQKANDLSITTIPALTGQIGQSEKAVDGIEQNLKSQQDSMSQLFGKAQKVTNDYSNANAFFSSAAEKPSLYQERPSEPEYGQYEPYEQDQGFTFNSAVYH
jgi:hypothetical protein